MQFEMPEPGEAHERLLRMTGEWSGEETMMPSPWSPTEEKRTATISSRALEGFFVVSDYVQRNAAGDVTFRGHGVYSYDPQAEEYRMYWYDSMGGPGGIAYGRLDGDVLTFENTSPMGRHRYRYTFGQEGARATNRFEMSMAPPGTEGEDGWSLLMVGDYTAGA